ncbi:MAG: hypothetical protein HY958_07070 [Bacteroidia bacterium]|nr:hypothetical protein [Bacteroidia bacterium]
MRTAQVQILVSKRDYLKYGFNNSIINFSKLKENILQELFQKSIEKSLRIAKKTGLSEMTLDEINAEIEKVRNNA